MKAMESEKVNEENNAELFIHLFNDVSEAIFVIDVDNGKFINVNRKACDNLGYTKEELLTMSVKEIEAVIPDNFSWVEHVNNLRSADHIIMEGAHVRKDGSQYPQEVNCKVLSLDSKEYVVAFVRDITDRKVKQAEITKKNQELEKLNENLDRFSYIVSHDLKAPLRAIENLSEWIADDLGSDLPETVEKNLGTLRGRVKRMNNLIDGILEYSKVGRTNIEWEEFSSKEMVENVLEMTIPESSNVNVSVCDSLDTIYAPKILIHQVFSNLISNAIKYNDKPKVQIDIGCEVNETEIEFYVRDNGPGIPEKYHESVFGIFQTIEARDKKESTGVGLSIVHKIIEELGGRIWVESAEGEGSTFKFIIPVKEPV